MDMGKRVQFLALDIISKIAFGKELAFLAADADVGRYAEEIQATMPSSCLASCVPPVMNFAIWGPLKYLMKMPKPTDKEGVGYMSGFAEQQVSERFGPNKVEKQDMVGHFVRHGFPQRRVQAEVLLATAAGFDTVATAIRATFSYLITSPIAFHKLRAEIDDAASAGRISSPVVKNAEARQLPNLQAVIREGLRMWPPFTGQLAKEVPPQGDWVGNVWVPRSTKIGHSTWALQFNPVYEGDAEVVRPEKVGGGEQGAASGDGEGAGPGIWALEVGVCRKVDCADENEKGVC